MKEGSEGSEGSVIIITTTAQNPSTSHHAGILCVIHSFSLWHRPLQPSAHILAASESKTPTPYQISSTPESPTNHSEPAPAPQPVSWSRAPSPSANHIFLSASAITLTAHKKVIIKRDTSHTHTHTPLQLIVLLEPVHQQLPDIHLPSLTETPPPSVTSLLGPHAAPRCNSQAQFYKCGKPKSATAVTLVFWNRRVWAWCVPHFICLHPLPGDIDYYPVIQKEWGSLLLAVKDLSNIDTIS
jgi:hypothetical protein